MNMSNYRNLALISLTLPGFLVCAQAQTEATQKRDRITTFVTRSGDKLMAGGKEYRFFGLAAPNIQQNETQIRADRTNRFPDEYEIRDILGGIQRVGGLATRTFSLSIYAPEDKGMPVYIPARRTYNEDAFQCLDRVIALAHEYNVRIIIPFIASQSFGGIRGVDEFSALSGKPKGSFWTDDEVKADFRHLLNFVVNRKNTVNGIAYKDDPAILCWQLGNEFGSYPGDRGLTYEEWSPRILAWSLEMAAYIKKLDSNHLLLEAGGADRKALLVDPNIDIISDHLYEYWNRLSGQPTDLALLARQSRAECIGKKPLMIDEFGLATTSNLRALMAAIRQEGISGGLMWSIRSHRRDGGWYYHNEGGTPVNSFHVPGFSAGFVYEETRLLDLLKRESYAIRGLAVPPVEGPAPAPVLMRKGEGFTWRGSTGAESYTLERAASASGPWEAIATGIEDSVITDVAKFEPDPEASEALVLYYDEGRDSGRSYFYRLKGMNIAGETGYSNVVESADTLPTAGTSGGKLFVSSFMTMHDPFFVELNEGIKRAVEAHGDWLLLLDGQHSREKQDQGVIEALKQDPAAIFLIPATDLGSIDGILAAAKAKGVPVILIDTDVDAPANLVACRVLTDNIGAGRMSCDELARVNPNAKIGILSFSLSKVCVDRVKGFTDEMAKYPGMKIVDIKEGHANKEGVRGVIREFLSGHPEMDAIFAINDVSALEALAGIDAAGRGGKITVLGVAGSYDGAQAILENRLHSSCAQMPLEIGRTAVEKAYDLIGGRVVEREVRVPVKLVTKDNAGEFLK
jgi:mannan endo-1,4-beta-mannosidase